MTIYTTTAQMAVTSRKASVSTDQSSLVIISKAAHASSASSVMAATNSADGHGSSASTDQSSRVIASKAAHESSASTIAAEVTKSGAAHESSASTDQSSRVIASKAAHESSASTIAAEVTKSGAAHETSASTDQSSRVVTSKAAHESSASTIAAEVTKSGAAHETSASTDQSSWVVTSKAAHASASSVLATPSVAARGAGLTARTGSPPRLPWHRRLVKTARHHTRERSGGCSSPLGLTTGDVLDWQISASSLYPATWDAGCQVKYARLHLPNGRAWCAGRRAAGEWVLVDLGVPAKVTGLLTQGKGDDEEWVTSLELSYSLDAYHWHFARDIYNNKKPSMLSS
ncbi:mucin-20-like [Eriocheir sinensis]|uniref:mucin-20-like n=1 Tax=Eriocheir sinensis TaxID=95602 RepID=UPI0021C8BDCA|nr:mucin-20-like [Eriocheir sinensis]